MELKNCPAYQSTKLHQEFEGYNQSQVICLNCDARGPMCEGGDKAWNELSRPDDI